MSNSMIGGVLGSLAGGAVGFLVGGYPGILTGAMYGASLGAGLATVVEGLTKEPPRNEQESIAGLMLQTSTLGAVIPMIYEKGRVAGNVFVLHGPFVEEDEEHADGASGGGGGGITVTKTYFVDLAIGLCDTFLTGEMQEIRKIWVDGNLFFDRAKESTYPEGFTFFSGAAVQAPAPMLEDIDGAGNVPGYPYLCYITWFNYEMGPFPRVPNFTFELAQRGAALTALHQMTWRPLDNSIWVAAPGVNQVLVYDHVSQDQYTHANVNVLEVGNTVDVSEPYATPMGFPMGWENGSDALWIAHPRDFMLKRIDAGGIVVDYVVDVPYTLLSGGAYHEGHMWFCAYHATTKVGYLIKASTGGMLAITTGQARTGVMKLAVASPTAVWVTDNHYPDGGGNSNAVRVNPATNTVTATVALGHSTNCSPTDLVVTPADSHVWVLDAQAGHIRRINTTPAVVSTIVIGGTPLQMAVASDGFIWVAATYQGGTVYRINPATNTAVAYESLRITQYNQGQPIMVAGDAGSMWVLSIKTGTVQRFATNGTSIVLRTGGTSHSLVAQDATHIWTGTTRGVVQKISMAGVIEEATGTADPRLRQIITRLCGAAGIAPAKLALSEIPNPIVALKLTSIQSVRAALELLMSGYQIFAIESGSKLKFRSREPGAVVATIPASELDAYDDTQHPEPPMTKGLTITKIPDQKLPTQLRFTYQSVARNYMDKTIMVYVSNSRAGQANPRAVKVDLVMRDDLALQVAQETLDRLWLQNVAYQFSISKKYGYLEPGDRVRVTSRTLAHTMILSEVSYRRPGILDCAARGDIAGQIGIYQGFAPGNSVDNDLDFLEHTIDYLLNLPAMHALDMAPRYHVGYRYGPAIWPGAALLRSLDGIGYAVVHSSAGARATTGLVAVALAAGTPYVIDEVSSFSVVLSSSRHTLSSISDATLIAGGNRVMIGDEVLHFGVATLTAPRTYTCSRLIRGQRGTEWAIAAHDAHESFVMLNGAVYEVGMAIAERNVARNYKTVTRGVQISDVPAELFTPISENLTPWAVGSPQAYRVAGDWVLTWIARSRFPGEWTDGQSFAFDPDVTGYRVQIYVDGTFSTLRRTINVALGADPEAIQTISYTVGQQMADTGGVAVVPLYWKVRAVGIYGVGRAVELSTNIDGQEFPDDTIGHLLNLPAMHALDVTPRYHIGYQFAPALWPGASLLRSIDGGDSYSVAHSATGTRATTGLVAVALPDGTPYVIDEVSSFSVILSAGIYALSSISDAALIAGGNRAMIGDEVIHFGVATLIAPSTYTCSRLIRGQRGTEWAIATHTDNETFIMLNDRVYELGMEIEERNVARNYKTVTTGIPDSAVMAESFSATSENLTPWAVGSPQAHRVAGDWVLTWIARSRFPGEWTDGQEFAFDEDITGYRVQIYTDGTFSTVMRTINVALSEDPEAVQTVNYSVAQQFVDSGGPPVVPLYWQVRAVGTYGVGRALELTDVA